MNFFFQKITKWYFSRKALPYWSVLLIDCLCVIVAGIIAYSVNHGLQASIDVSWTLFLLMVGAAALFMVGFFTFKTYRGIVRYSSFTDLVRIIFAVLLGMVILVVIETITGVGKNLVMIGVTDIVLTGLFIIVFMWIIRVWVKTLYDDTNKQNRTTPVFIYGVKEGGVAIAKSINSMEDSKFIVNGFVSSADDISNKILMGKKIHPYDLNLAQTMRKKGVYILMVSPLMMQSLRENNDVLDSLLDAGIKIYVTPNAKEWDGNDSSLDVSTMREIEPEDLLPRDKIDINLEAAAEMIENKVVLITGAAGSIGSEIVRQIASFNPRQLLLIDQAETPMHDIRLMMQREFKEIDSLTLVADITDERIMQRVFETYKPEYVFHAAAYKHVPMMEDNPYEAVINNIWGTKLVADLAVKCGAKKFVMVSTDKAVNPTNVMGASKRICEIYVQSLDQAIKERKIEGKTKFITTRFGNVLGSNGSVIPIFQEQIKKGGPVTVTHPDIIRYFMLIPEACKLVIEAGTMGEGGEILVFDMGQPVKIADLAERMIKLSGAKNVEIKFTGLRDGEKLYEEVLNDKEITLPTFNPKIKIAKVREYDYGEANSEITSLIKDSATYSDIEIVAVMKRIVPEYISQHSKYQILDNKESQ